MKTIRCSFIIITVIVCLALWWELTFAALLRVGISGYEYASIQKAIDSAKDTDEIVVHEGIYLENIDFKGKKIALRSINGPEKQSLMEILPGV